MASPIGVPLVENEGTSIERRVSVVDVTDVVSHDRRYCLDIYDVRGNLLKRVGYRSGPITDESGVVWYGDQLTRISWQARDYVQRVVCDLGLPSDLEA